MAYFIGKGYGISNLTDLSGRPLLTYQGPNDKKPFLLSDRVAQTFDFTVPQVLKAGAMKNGRLDPAVSSYVKNMLGGVLDDELDHKISLELGGSNTPANLWIQHGRTEGASFSSDQLENNLALDVVAGKISLLTAWRTLAEQKGFLLGEDIKTGTTFSFSEASATIFTTAAKWLHGEAGTEAKKMSESLRAQMADDFEKLKQNPLNQRLQTQIFDTQSRSLQDQLSINGTEAGKLMKATLASYTANKGIDPREILSATNANIQRIINNSKNDPNIYGVPSATIIRGLALVQVAGGIAFAVSAVLAVVAIFTVGPELVLAGIVEGAFGTLLSLLAGTGAGIGAISAFGVGEAITRIAFPVLQSVKEMYDNQYLLPTQQINGLKESLAIQKGLAAFLPSEKTAPSSETQKGGGSGFSSYPVSGTSVHISVVSGGALGTATTFTPADHDIFENITELQHAAEQNLARYLGGIFGQLVYHLKLVGTVRLNDGTVRVGTTQLVQHGVTKKGRPTYKKVTNKFVVADINYKTLAGVWKKLDEIVIGAVDEKGFHPAAQDLAGLSTAISSYLVANHLGGVTQINLPSPASGQPTQTAPAQVTAPTTTPSPTSPPPTGSVMSAPVAAAVPAPIPPPYFPQPTTPTPLPTFTPSPPALDYPGLTEAEAAMARVQGPSTSTWNTSPKASRDAWKRDFDNQLVAVAKVAATVPTLPTGMRSANGYIYNLRTSSDIYSGPLDSAPAAAMGLLYQQLGLGSLSMYVGSAQQIAAIDARLPKS